MVNFEGDFCGGPFWNYSLVWQSKQPDFTACFQKTVLSWIPLAVIAILHIFEVPGYFSRANKNRHILFNYYNITKLILTLSLIGINIAGLFYVYFVDLDSEGSNVYPADYLFEAAFLVSHVLSLGFLILSLRYGARSSYTQFLYYFISTLCQAIVFRSFVVQNETSDTRFVLLTVHFGLSLCLLFCNCFADRAPSKFDEKLKDFQDGPEISASVPSKLTFIWVTGLIWKGLRATLDVSMLWTLHPNLSSNGIFPIFSSFFTPVSEAAKNFRRQESSGDDENDKSSKNDKKTISVFPSLFKTFGYEFFLGSFFQVIVVGMSIVGPQIQKAMINHIAISEFNNPYAFAWKGFMYAGLLLASSVFYNISNGQYNNKMYLVAMKVRTCLNSVIYRKSLKLSNTARKESTVGQIVNLMQLDVSMIMVRYKIS